MRGRIIEIAGEPRHLSLHRGFVCIYEEKQELGRVDFDSVLSLMITSRGATLTSSLLAECADRNIPVLTCDSRYQPAAITLPVQHHSDQHRRHLAQAKAKKGQQNQLWKDLVIGKIRNQAAVLDFYEAPEAARLKRLAGEVRAGDPDNREALAAQTYWPALMGRQFRRGDADNPVNGLLNYGYAVLRSAMVRAVLLAGLHPGFGLHHANKNNPFCLVDDLMEPYRPLADQLVRRMLDRDLKEVTPQTKPVLAGLAAADLAANNMTSPLFQDMHRLAYSLWEILDGQKGRLAMPQILCALELEALFSPC